MNTVNGLPLPPELEEAMAAGRWKLPDGARNLDKLGIRDVADLALLSVAAMRAETDDLKRMAGKDEGDFFSLVTSSEAGLEDGQLDVAKAVIIAGTRGQEVLCLDYSIDPGPRVVATHYGAGRVTWVEVARSLGELLRILSAEPA